jgi:centrosomal protein CEP104
VLLLIVGKLATSPFWFQVVEIAGLTDHLLTECENKANFAKCPRCSEAIPKAELDQHLAEKSCNGRIPFGGS